VAASKISTGQRFGRLTASLQVVNPSRYRIWRCTCDCGGSKDIRESSLVAGYTKSCGCLIREFNRATKTTHGMQHTAEYRVWRSMIARCTNRRSPLWKRYGARGVSVCEQWKSFENFYADMGPRPTSKHSIDRFPLRTGNYEPGNTRWATPEEQQGNRSISVRIAHDGETHHLSEWARRFGLSEWARRFGLRVDTLARRYARGDRPPRLFRPARSYT